MKNQNPLGLIVGILIFTVGLFALGKACQENRGQTVAPSPLEIGPLTTNRWTNVIKVLEEQPGTTPCPVCGSPISQQLVRMQIWERVTGTLIIQGKTNQIIRTGEVTNWIGTNYVIRQRIQPGWTMPPTPPVQPPPLTTNKPTTWINHDPMGRTLVSAVEDGRLAAHEEWRQK